MNEIERHWDRICLMVLAIATAAPAAALLIFRETSQAGNPMGWMRILPAFMVLGITGAYGIAVLRAGGAIMAPQDGNEGARSKDQVETPPGWRRPGYPLDDSLPAVLAGPHGHRGPGSAATRARTRERDRGGKATPGWTGQARAGSVGRQATGKPAGTQGTRAGKAEDESALKKLTPQ